MDCFYNTHVVLFGVFVLLQLNMHGHYELSSNGKQIPIDYSNMDFEQQESEGEIIWG